jgi:Spy/CpxP family protein refolding chaperone
MKNRINGKVMVIALILGAFIIAPSLGGAKEKEHDWGRYKEYKEKIAKELKLSPEKTKQFLAIAEKYSKKRQELSEAIEKSYAELDKVMAAPKPDEAKVKDLVKAVTTTHDNFVKSYGVERDEEFALLSALEQGQYLTVTNKWRREYYEKHRMPEKKEQPQKK